MKQEWKQKEELGDYCSRPDGGGLESHDSSAQKRNTQIWSMFLTQNQYDLMMDDSKRIRNNSYLVLKILGRGWWLFLNLEMMWKTQQSIFLEESD